MKKKFKTGMLMWRSRAAASLLCGFAALSTWLPANAETQGHPIEYKQTASITNSVNQRNSAWSLGRLWSAAANAGVYFTYARSVDYSRDNILEIWRSTKTDQSRILSVPDWPWAPDTEIVGVTGQHVYLSIPYDTSVPDYSDDYFRDVVTLYRININGDPSTLRHLKTFDTGCTFLSLARTTDDQFVAVVNVHEFGAPFGNDIVACLSYTRGVMVYRIGDNESTMSNIGTGLPLRLDRRTHVRSVGAGDIFENRLRLFTTKHKPGEDRAGKTGLYDVPLSGPRARGVFQFPPLRNNRTYTLRRSDPYRSRLSSAVPRIHPRLGPGEVETAKGASLLYSRVDAAIGAGCELWRFNGLATGSMRLAKLNTSNDDWKCWPEMAIVRGNRLIFKKIDHGTKTIELWETRGTRATTKKLRSWRVPGINLKTGFINLRVIGDRVWFVQATSSGLFKVMRSNSIRGGGPVRFQQLWRSQEQPGSHVRVYEVAEKPLLMVRKFQANNPVGRHTLYRVDPQTGKLVSVISRVGSFSNFVTDQGEVVFSITDSGQEKTLYGLDLDTGNLAVRNSFR